MKKSLILKFAILVICVLFAVIALAPFFFYLELSFKPGVELVRKGINFDLDITKMSLKNYWTLITGKDGVYLYWYRNSVVITFLYTLISLFLTSFVGYGLAAYNFKGKNLIFIIVLIVMMTPVEILILPLFKLTVMLRMIDTYAGVILPFAVSPFAVFFFRQYARGIPKDFIDAARIDGCTEFGIYFKVIMPLMLPAYGAMTILLAMGSWNNFVWPLIVLRDNTMLTLPIGLGTMITPYGNNYDMLIAGAVMSVVPIIILYIFNQKAFISGLTIGGIKG